MGTAAKPLRRRVLVVEDDTDAREVLGALIEMLGHEVTTAGTGAEAVDRASGRPPEVVLIDIGLPDIDGHEVARRIRDLALTDGSVLVALTGYSDPAERARAREAGFDEYLVKPIDADALKRLLVLTRGGAAKRA